MIGVLYLFLCFCLGWAFCSFALPGLSQMTATDYLKRKISVSPYMLLIPAWFVSGTLLLTWTVYLTAYLCRNTKEPLWYANLIAMPLAIAVTVLTALYRRKKHSLSLKLLCSDKKAWQFELYFMLIVAGLACILMWTSFFVMKGELYVGVSVFSDFSPHIGMIRSFSYGNNFPTTYSHYAGEDIRYHFMFQFLAGNLEYLGLRIDFAFNLPSILSFITAFMLLYLLAVKISGKVAAGWLACLFFAFRSSKTLFTYLSQLPQGSGIWKALSENTDFISSTPNEDWGLWNLNVYCNQRHLAFGLTAVFFILLLFLPYMYDMFAALQELRLAHKEHNKKSNNKTQYSYKSILRTLLFTAEAWKMKDFRLTVVSGLLLGSLAFFHGAAVIGILTVLFVMAILSQRRMDFLFMAIITIVLSELQTIFFIHGSAVSTKFFFGFIAENKTLFGVASYLDRLLGILPWVLLAALCYVRSSSKYLILAFTAPLIFAFTISLTVDVTVNHKYIMMSCILLGILAAEFITGLLERKGICYKIVSAALIVMLTATGLYDFAVLLKKNTPDTAIILDLKDPLTKWIDDNSTSQDIFLTANYAINQVVLGGAMLYEGWPYYPWSAGYDTDYRTAQVARMYEAATKEELKGLVEENKIRFIIVDHENRVSTDYMLNEDTIRQTYERVYSQGEGEWETSIYDTSRPLEE